MTGAGTVVLQASQAASGAYAAGSATAIFTVTEAVILSLSASPSVQFLNNPVALTATLTATGGAPTGSVSFFDGATPIGSNSVSAGKAALTISTLALGTHTITSTYSGDGTFASQTSASIIVTIEDFSLSILNPNVTISHGGTASFNLVVDSIGSVGMASGISLDVTGGPPHGTITFSPSSVATGSGTTPVQLLIYTPDYPDGSPVASVKSTANRYSFAFCGAFGMLLVFGNRRRKYFRLAALCVALASLTMISGCGAGWGTQVFDLKITAKSGQTVRTVSATITTSCADGQKFCRW